MCCYFTSCLYILHPIHYQVVNFRFWSCMQYLFIEVVITAFVDYVYLLADGNVYVQVQGMSFVAAVLLLNMDVHDAFTCFANLLNRPCQNAFFRMDRNLVCVNHHNRHHLFRSTLTSSKKVITVYMAIDKCGTWLARLERALITTLNSLPKTLKTYKNRNIQCQ